MTPEQMRIALADLLPKLFVIHKPNHDPFGYYRENGAGYTTLANAWIVTEEVGRKYVSGRPTDVDRVVLEAAPVPDPTTDANAAIAIVAMMRKRGWNATLENGLDGTWEALFHKPDYEGSPKEHRGVIQGEERVIYYGAADTVQLAICEAACKALKL